jgi:AraC family transcriptional regulator of adaptative response/methylated-DNA-[protein]-cysteine methyltransferase
MIGKNYSDSKFSSCLYTAQINTALGPIIAIADDEALYLLDFITGRKFEQRIEHLRKRGFALMAGNAMPLRSIEYELTAYFAGKLMEFKTPYRLWGSTFQQQVWQTLCQIPYGETLSYAKQSAALGKPTAVRAVANANGANRLAIIVPCHRVIASDGSLGGYGSGLAIKQELLNHEKKYKQEN